MTAKRALAYLEKDPITNMDMIVPLKRGSAQILYAGDDGVCILETKSRAYMMTVETPELGKSVMSEFTNSGYILSFHQEFMLGFFTDRARGTLLENHQGVYFSKEKLPVSDKLKIMPVVEQNIGFVIQNYDFDVGADYISDRVKSRKIFGGYENGEFVGFVGIHAEGSIGLLKVLKEHRGKGFGTDLASYAINHQLERKTVPFVQIGVGNEYSLATVKRLGFEMSEKKVYWLF